jgi:RNA polymerase sigma factor (sigma-70 family)
MDGSFESQTRSSLICAVRNPRNERAWAAFTQRYEGVIRACCRAQGLGPEAADELTQVVLVKFVKAMPGFVYDPPRGFRHWLNRVVVNTVNDYWRQATRRSGQRRHVRARNVGEPASPGRHRPECDGLNARGAS